MDKRRLRFACVVLLWGLASGCTWDAGWEHAPPQDAAQAAFPIEQAQRIFEQQVLRHSPSAASEGPRLSPTDFTPLWRGARFEANEYLYCYDVEIHSDLGLAARVAVERRGKRSERLVAPVQKLIVARSRTDSTAYAYLLTLVPDWECHRRWRGVVGEIFSHAGDKSRFSGVAIYTTLSGQTVSVSRYDEDGPRGTAYLGDPRAANFSQALERARGLLDGVRLLGVTVTRGGGDGTEMIYENGEWIVNCKHCNNEGCEICTIVVDPNPCPWCGTWPCKCDDSPDPDPDPYEPPEDPHDPKPCPACAQYPCVCNDDRNDPKNEDDPEPDPEKLQSNCPYGKCTSDLCSCCTVCKGPCICPNNKCHLSPCVCPQEKDCDLQAENNSAAVTNFYARMVASPEFIRFLSTVANTQYEYSTTLNYSNGKYYMSTPRTDHKTNSVVPDLRTSSVCAIHNHPSGNPPSFEDAFTLTNLNGQTRGVFEAAFICPPDGNSFYVLFIEDESRADKFTSKYTAITLERERARIATDLEVFYNFTLEEAKMYAMSYILESKNSGIKLLYYRRDGSSTGFKQTGMTYDLSNNPVYAYKAYKCK